MSILSLILFGIVFLLIVQYALNQMTVKGVYQYSSDQDVDMNNMIEQHRFENYIHLEKSTKKKVFIHLPFERNARSWLDFGARSSNDLNMDICLLCIYSVIKHLGGTMDIVLYDNHNVKDLIGDSNEEDLCNIENPSILSGVDLKQWEGYCRAKILYKYGGVIIEPYYYFTRKPDDKVLFPDSLTISQEVNDGHNVSHQTFIPTTNHWMSAPKKDPDVQLYIKYLNYLCVHHYSADHKHFDKTFEKLYALPFIHPKKIGCANTHGDPVYVNDLLSKRDLELDSDLFCLFINVPHLKKYRKDGWFLKMNKDQIQQSNTYMGEFIRSHP